jgi:DNA repair photolyase
MIISASRRTDIPAFYSEWFSERVKDGYLLVRNPFNAHQIRHVTLSPETVSAIVFWTRNPKNIFHLLSTLDKEGFNYYFQYTITGYPRVFEKSVPSPLQAIETFLHLSDLIGPGRVVWRYDPILLSNTLTIDEHKRLFSKIASLLAGKTIRSVISFADFYQKTEKNLSKIPNEKYDDITKQKELLYDLSAFMAKTAESNGMSITSCAEIVDLSSIGIPHGKCIDEKILSEEFGLNVSSVKDSGQREACGCIKSIDIGEYNTCLHGCSYCYATFNEKSVQSNRNKHDPKSPFLLGTPPENYQPINVIKQKSLF